MVQGLPFDAVYQPSQELFTLGKVIRLLARPATFAVLA